MREIQIQSEIDKIFNFYELPEDIKEYILDEVEKLETIEKIKLRQKQEKESEQIGGNVAAALLTSVPLAALGEIAFVATGISFISNVLTSDYN
jgi:hypothetical protein